jgi:hypothetical protein
VVPFFFLRLCARCLSQLTTGRPKPKKASNRKHAGGLLPETGRGVGELNPNATTRKPSSRNAAAQGEARIPAPSRIHQPSTHTLVTPSHANLPTPLSTHLSVSKPDRPNPDITDQALINVTSTDSAAQKKKKPSPSSLFGLAGLDAPPPPPQRASQAPPACPKSPRSPRRQSRIPSTGVRALVMDVAQAMQEAQAQASTTGADATSESSVPPPVAPQKLEFGAPMMEKRVSSFDRYSAIVVAPPTRSVCPEDVVQAKVEITPDTKNREDFSPDQQEDDSVVEIRELGSSLSC